MMETLQKRLCCGDREDIAEEAKEILRQAEANQKVRFIYDGLVIFVLSCNPSLAVLKTHFNCNFNPALSQIRSLQLTVGVSATALSVVALNLAAENSDVPPVKKIEIGDVAKMAGISKAKYVNFYR